MTDSIDTCHTQPPTQNLTLSREEGWAHVVEGTDLGIIDLTQGSAEPDPRHGCEEDCKQEVQLLDEFSDSGESVFSDLSALPPYTPRSPSSSDLDSGSTFSGEGEE